MNGRKVMLGVGMGFGAGYLAVRSYEAFLELRNPAPSVAKDAAAYARVRRALEVLGTVRGTAGFVAFAYGPLGAGADRTTLRLPIWARPACYHAALSLASAITELPVSFIEEYSLERRFGLSDQSLRGWQVITRRARPFLRHYRRCSRRSSDLRYGARLGDGRSSRPSASSLSL
jgi:hypothetical protein